jgi:hypothetical protein
LQIMNALRALWPAPDRAPRPLVDILAHVGSDSPGLAGCMGPMVVVSALRLAGFVRPGRSGACTCCGGGFMDRGLL